VWRGAAGRGEVWLAWQGVAGQGAAGRGWHGNNNERKGNDMSDIPRYRMTNSFGYEENNNGAWV